MNNTKYAGKINEVTRLNEIIDGVSRLPLESQEYVLGVVRGMIFTNNIMKKENEGKEI